MSVANRSLVRIQGSTFETTNTGIVARDGSHLVINSTRISTLADYGLNLENGTTAFVGGSTITAKQTGTGGPIRGAVGLYQGSTLRIGSTSISGTQGNGIFGAMGSVVWLEAGVDIHDNTGHGIAMTDTGVVGKYHVLTNVSIRNNGGFGISCSGTPGVAQLYGFPSAGQPLTDVTGNVLGAYGCPASPSPRMQ